MFAEFIVTRIKAELKFSSWLKEQHNTKKNS